MADQEQVDFLKQGVDAWNEWREKTHTTKIDLSEANLSEANLRGAYLSNAYLSEANLSEANLSEAYLINANLINAYLRGADLSGANLRNADLSGAKLLKADLSGTKLLKVKLLKAKLSIADLSGANLTEANLSGAKLLNADLRNADLSHADLRGTDLTQANIEGVILDYAIVDGETLIVRCKINDSTYAHGVGLDSARIEESLKTKLKKNIRKKYWVERYQYHLDLGFIKKLLMLIFSRKLLIAIHKWIYRNITRESTQKFQRALFSPTFLKSSISVFWSCLVRLFWWTSDYGSSTTRLIWSFLITSVIYTLIYFSPVFIGSDYTFIQGIQFSEVIDSTGKSVPYTFNNWGILLRAFYFSVVTMTTLGFGDISANPASTCGHFLVISQVLIGYVLLGALITRLSILFQDVG